LLSGVGFQQFLTQDSDLTFDLVEEGKEHMKREKRRRQRMEESASRKREFNSRFGDPESRSGGSEVRQRAADIVKARGANPNLLSSPERGLLSEASTSSTQHDLFRQENERSTSSFKTDPPRNIFDDL